MRPRSRFESVELPVAAGFTGNQVNFPDIPELRSDADKDACIFAIAISTADSVPLCESGNANATLAQVQAGFLTLYILGTEKLLRMPLQRFMNIRGNGATYFYAAELFEMEPERVDWTKSFVSFAGLGAVDTAFSYLFEFWYEWIPPGGLGKFLTNQSNQWSAGIIRVN
jgi:hypothetical protein